MIRIIREPLADPGRSTEVARYDEITLYTANCFCRIFAQDEADRRDDITHIAVLHQPFRLVLMGQGSHVQYRLICA